MEVFRFLLVGRITLDCSQSPIFPYDSVEIEDFAFIRAAIFIHECEINFAFNLWQSKSPFDCERI